jgi:hypothetical protein
VVFHIFPVIGSTVQYGMDAYKFFFDCWAKYGDCFTFILLGTPTTVYLGKRGNNFILNGRNVDLNAEEIYGKLTTPCFGQGVVYDCSNERLMDQKRVRITFPPQRHTSTPFLDFIISSQFLDPSHLITLLTILPACQRRFYNPSTPGLSPEICPRSH